MAKLNEGHYHEAVDRSALITEIIENTLLKHPVFKEYKHVNWRNKIIKAQEIIAEVYQEVAAFEPK